MAFKCGTRLDPAGTGRSPVSTACRHVSKRMKAFVKGNTAIYPLSLCAPAIRGHELINGKS
jgi:hypothetical protein